MHTSTSTAATCRRENGSPPGYTTQLDELAAANVCVLHKWTVYHTSNHTSCAKILCCQFSTQQYSCCMPTYTCKLFHRAEQLTDRDHVCVGYLMHERGHIYQQIGIGLSVSHQIYRADQEGRLICSLGSLEPYLKHFASQTTDFASQTLLIILQKMMFHM